MSSIQHLNTVFLLGEVLQSWSYDDNFICRLQTKTAGGSNYLVNVVIPNGTKLGIHLENGSQLQVTGAIRNDEVEKPLTRLVKEPLPENLREKKVMQIYTQVYASSWQVIA